MILFLRVLNSPLCVFAHVIVIVYFLQRFFRALRTHYQLMDETVEFSRHVEQCRSSLDYVTNKVAEAVTEIEEDIGKEVSLTHHLTQLSARVSALSKRFNNIEEGVIEYARISHNMENATVETPSDINEEVKRIFQTLKNKNQALQHHDKLPTPESRSPVQSPKRRKVSRSKSRNTTDKAPLEYPDNQDAPQPRRRLRKKKNSNLQNPLLSNSPAKMSDNSGWDSPRPKTPNVGLTKNSIQQSLMSSSPAKASVNFEESSGWDSSRPRTPTVGSAQNSVHQSLLSSSPAKASAYSGENSGRDLSKPRTPTFMPTQNSFQQSLPSSPPTKTSIDSRKKPSRDSSKPRKPIVRPTKKSMQQTLLNSPPAKTSTYSRENSGGDSSRPRTPTVVPTVELLKEKKGYVKKTIGFRPSWMTES